MFGSGLVGTARIIEASHRGFDSTEDFFFFSLKFFFSLNFNYYLPVVLFFSHFSNRHEVR